MEELPSVLWRKYDTHWIMFEFCSKLCDGAISLERGSTS